MYTETQQKLLAILPRVFVSISLSSCCYVLYSVSSTSGYRKRVYHRLMFGLAASFLPHLCNKLWGSAAVPAGTPGVYGAHGNTTTCTLHGFLNQMGYWPLSYYVGLSFYSAEAVKHKFDQSKFEWIEKYIHCFAFFINLLMSIYLVAISAFNYNGYSCYIASVPLLCGDVRGIECTRGPQRIALVQIIFGAGPVLVILLVPTFVMIRMWFTTTREERSTQEERVATPAGRQEETTTVTTMTTLVEDETNEENGENEDASKEGEGESDIFIDASTVRKQASIYLLVLYWQTIIYSIDSIVLLGFGKEIFALRLFSICNEKLTAFYITIVYYVLRVKINVTKPPIIQQQEETQPRSSSPEPFLSIFDGTHISESRWSEFLYQGDSDDMGADEEESERWEGVVQT